MNSSGGTINLNEDDNAVDEFYAQSFYKLKASVNNFQNENLNKNESENHTFLNRKEINFFNDSTNQNTVQKLSYDHVVNNKRKSYNETDENASIKRKPQNDQIDYFRNYFQAYDRNHYEVTRKLDSDTLSTLNNLYSQSRFVTSLSVPPLTALGRRWCNEVVVAVPWTCERLLKCEAKSMMCSKMIETSRVENRTLSVPCRRRCSPCEQYSLTPQLQYMSDCLIRACSPDLENEHEALFTAAIAVDAVNVLSRRNPNQSHGFMAESVNTAYFHELCLERLPCNRLSDFMPQHTELTGRILSGFVNDLFELSRVIFLPSDVVHGAVDLIYQYLTRVPDVPLNDLKLVALGAAWVSAKLEGRQYFKKICTFADCTPDQLKHAELRLLVAIDCNLTKPNAVTFRNRFIGLEQTTSTVSLISSFLLDMSLHCYTVMVLPSSQRAAAALWLARLVERFDHLRHGHAATATATGDCHEDEAALMDAVWPEHFRRLTGQQHPEVARLAVKMHVVVLALLCRGQQRNPSVDACYHKYSHESYRNLTGSYERFTSRVVLQGTQIYCRLHGLEMRDWLEHKEYETLQLAAHGCPSVSPMDAVATEATEAHSCPELSSTPIIVAPAGPAPASLRKLDSGYSTCSSGTAHSSQHRLPPL